MHYSLLAAAETAADSSEGHPVLGLVVLGIIIFICWAIFSEEGPKGWDISSQTKIRPS